MSSAYTYRIPRWPSVTFAENTDDAPPFRSTEITFSSVAYAVDGQRVLVADYSGEGPVPTQDECERAAKGLAEITGIPHGTIRHFEP